MTAPLRSDVSYLLARGLSSIDGAIARWMIQNRARHLIFASRSGLVREEGENAIKALKSDVVNITVFKCDISDEFDMHKLVTKRANTMPPHSRCRSGGNSTKDMSIPLHL